MRGAQQSRVVGCLLGAALGDALGAAVEAGTWTTILEKCGPAGIQRPDLAFGRVGAITDATQLTLFTAEGIIRTRTRFARGKQPHMPSMVWFAYRRWGHTQGVLLNTDHEFWEQPNGWLLSNGFLYNRRNLAKTTLAVVQQRSPEPLPPPVNHSKGNGAVARSAPCGITLIPNDKNEFPLQSLELASEVAALTHGHRVAQDAAGAYAAILSSLCQRLPLAEAAQRTQRHLQAHGASDEVAAHIDSALGLSSYGTADGSPIEDLPRKWRGVTAEEALAIGLYSALTARDFASGVRRAVNHSGSSAACGAICGGILGAALGAKSLPEDWLRDLEGRHVIETVARDLHRLSRLSYRVTRLDDCRYPGV